MCGIAGFWGGGGTGEECAAVARQMSNALRHRGPDDGGHWTDDAAGVAIGHRRLSILDLSPEGHQPMVSEGGRYVVAFNGEIYNFWELRRELDLHRGGGGASFRGRSDTEVLLAGVEHWGLTGAVERFIGMFAFALWDRRERVLHLVRDRLGIKPLYYGWAGDTLLFGSELRALRAHPSFRAEIDRGALALLLRHNCIPAPWSIYHGIRKLEPGTILTLRTPDRRSGTATTFWSAKEVAEAGARNPFPGTAAEAVDDLEGLLRDAVRLRMVADVPLGAFLSGGVDSSLVAALMQAQSDRPVKTFSIGSDQAAYDEARHARAVAHHIGTEHTELYVSPQDALSVIPRLPEMFDEPFSDSSQIPTALVSALARRDVTVSLSGDGGDELFAGYNRHVWGERAWRLGGRVPRGLRRAAGRAITGVAPQTWDRVFRRLGRVVPQLDHRMPGYKLHKLAGALAADTQEALYLRLASHWADVEGVVLGATEPPTLLTTSSRQAALEDFTSRMMYLDLVTYLPDDILTKVDRASMAVGLEARVPLLDHRVVEFAWRLPLSMKLRDGQNKWALRQVLYRHVPRALIDRPKTGFGIPLDGWLRGPLRAWAAELLDEKRLAEEGFFDPAPVRRKWTEHLSGKQDWQYDLWDVLMFQAWFEAQRNEAAGPVLMPAASGGA